jgi:hypothetical protein
VVNQSLKQVEMWFPGVDVDDELQQHGKVVATAVVVVHPDEDAHEYDLRVVHVNENGYAVESSIMITLVFIFKPIAAQS